MSSAKILLQHVIRLNGFFNHDQGSPVHCQVLVRIVTLAEILLIDSQGSTYSPLNNQKGAISIWRSVFSSCGPGIPQPAHVRLLGQSMPVILSHPLPLICHSLKRSLVISLQLPLPGAYNLGPFNQFFSPSDSSGLWERLRVPLPTVEVNKQYKAARKCFSTLSHWSESLGFQKDYAPQSCSKVVGTLFVGPFPIAKAVNQCRWLRLSCSPQVSLLLEVGTSLWTPASSLDHWQEVFPTLSGASSRSGESSLSKTCRLCYSGVLLFCSPS